MRLIDADALIGDLHNHAFLEGDDRAIVYSVIQKQPTIEQPKQRIFVHSDGTIEPLQKHGHWKEVQEFYDDEQHWQCSACGCEWYLEAGNPEENNMHYCPECGAKMEGDVKQDET